MLEWPKIDTAWSNDGLGEKWQWLRQCRSVVTGAIEPLRREKIIGSSLQAKVRFGVADLQQQELLTSVPFEEICIVAENCIEVATGKTTLTPSEFITEFAMMIPHVEHTPLQGCGRCCRHLPEETEDGGW